tara:strand:- start:44 stop:223 length:180 start_codon:yes stop_codon:yes gene_type:complete
MSLFFWLGIVLLVDAALSILAQDFLKNFVQISRLKKIFWIELFLAFVLIIIFFVKRYIF